MHNVNASAEILQHDALSPALTTRQAAVTAANRTRRPLVLLKGGASVRFLDAAPDTSALADKRSGVVAACIGMIRAVMTAAGMKRQARKEARMRRMARDEMAYLGNHILRDIGLSHGRTDIALREASLHGPRL